MLKSPVRMEPAGRGNGAKGPVSFGLVPESAFECPIASAFADEAPGRLDHRLHRDARHVRHAGLGGPGQGVAKELPHRQAREDQVAELLAPARSFPAIVGRVDHRREVHAVTREVAGELRGLVMARVEVRVVDRHLLEAAHVRVAHFLCGARDARRIDLAVHAPAPLDVPLQEFH